MKELFIKFYLSEEFDYVDADGTKFVLKVELQSLIEGCENQ